MPPTARAALAAAFGFITAFGLLAAGLGGALQACMRSTSCPLAGSCREMGSVCEPAPALYIAALAVGVATAVAFGFITYRRSGSYGDA